MIAYSHELKIHNNIWTIKLTNDEPLLLVNNRICKGSIVYAKREIYIDQSLTEPSMLRAIIHELSHAYIYETQFNISDMYSEENLCDFMALYGREIINISKNIIRKLKMSNII